MDVTVTVAQAQTMTCPNCNVQPGQPCTQPIDNGRKPVSWVHLVRAEVYRTKNITPDPPVYGATVTFTCTQPPKTRDAGAGC